MIPVVSVRLDTEDSSADALSYACMKIYTTFGLSAIAYADQINGQQMAGWHTLSPLEKSTLGSVSYIPITYLGEGWGPAATSAQKHL